MTGPPAAPAPGGPAQAVSTRLRPARPQERDLLERWRREPASEFDDFAGTATSTGTGGTGTGDLVTRDPGSGELVVTDGDDQPLGTVSWRPVRYGPNAGSTALNIGIALRPAARGHGHGTRAQRMLVEYLFAQFPVVRVEAATDVDNLAEQQALERAGFVREGVLRQAQERRGTRHDLVSYSRLRTDG